MKTIKKSCLWLKITMFAVFILLSTSTLFAIMNTEKTSDSICDRVKLVLQQDYIPKGIYSCDSAVLFLPAKDANDAFAQALSLCVKLGALPPENGHGKFNCLFPGNNGQISIHILEPKKQFVLRQKQAVYVGLFLTINCNDLKLKEIKYITLKSYKTLKEKKELKSKEK